MDFGTIDFNNLVLLVIAVIGLVNTALVIWANSVATTTNKLAVETKEIAVKTEINTNSLVAKLLASEKEVSRRQGVDEGKEIKIADAVTEAAPEGKTP